MNGKHCVFVAASDLVGTQQPKNPYQTKMFCLFTFNRNKCSHSSPKVGDICAHSENTKYDLCTPAPKERQTQTHLVGYEDLIKAARAS